MANGTIKRKVIAADDAQCAKRVKMNSDGAYVGSDATHSTAASAPTGNHPEHGAVAASCNPPTASNSTSGVANDPAIGTDALPICPRLSKKGKEKAATSSTENDTSTKPKTMINKLVPPRPFPTVPTSVSATGPRSAHHEGKNYIAITRKTKLGAYLRRCKEIVLKDGYKTLHLNAMGAAIPHLMTLVVSLPSILPYAADEIHTDVLTGTVEVQDELIPNEEDEDISYRTREKSSVSVLIKIGDGVDEKGTGCPKRTARGRRRGRLGLEEVAQAKKNDKEVGAEPGSIVAPERDDNRMDEN
ncbi:hypothetical protein EW146_g404 [Bondarzewia mesenterica]|uniref:Uncharacterized protein n=1 Tax=Bondarzewia mesenterica TaxID=1095465 RepID=A0A4S4MDH6_9AGAM|nr:hypothetical protein EW146_g404 [Bondarzewia mesenterica]